MNYQEIETFLTVLELKSISAAAQRLFISQGTASHRIQSLENELDLILFHRQPGKKQLLLTPAGREFFLLAKQWKALYQETMQLKTAPNFKYLNIGGIDVVNNFTLLPFYKQLLHDCPQLNLKISTYHSNEIYAMINKYTIDVGFTYLFTNYPDVNVMELFTDPLVLVVPADSHLTGTITPNQLTVNQEIYVNWGTDFEVWHNRYFNSFGQTLITVGTGHMQLAMLDTPDTWALVPQSLATPKTLQQQQLRQLALNTPAPVRTCYQLTHKKMLPEKQEALQVFDHQLQLFLASN